MYSELYPIFNNQKSFYGKARTYRNKDCIYLISYNTIVCYIDTRHYQIHRLWDGYSKTTLMHINEFGKQFIGKHFNLTAADWREMRVE